MKPPRVSLIALTRDRPREFRVLLDALRYQRMRDFELIVVGERPKVTDHGAPKDAADRLTYLTCAEENISLSRNIGLSHASGDVIAFIDDDAAPEPDWLEELLKPFETADVGAVGGYVRGRNGVDFQWRGAIVDRYGAHFPVDAQDLAQRNLSDPKGEFFLSTVGVNSAFRRKALMKIGGFDENFHYFLDESDVCIRMLAAGWRTVMAPQAEVHHAYAESQERSSNRAPRDLFQIAASRTYFGLIHGDPDWFGQKLAQFQHDQRKRLKKFVQLGRLSRRQAAWIAGRMEEGCAVGAARFDDGPRIGETLTKRRRGNWTPYASSHRARPLRVALAAAEPWRRRVYRLGERLAAEGCEVSVIDFSLSARRLNVEFRDGVWRHVGGVLGRESFHKTLSAPRRCLKVKRELDRISQRRSPDVIVRPGAQKYRIGGEQTVAMRGWLPGFVAEPLRPGAAAQLLDYLA